MAIRCYEYNDQIARGASKTDGTAEFPSSRNVLYATTLNVRIYIYIYCLYRFPVHGPPTYIYIYIARLTVLGIRYRDVR